MNAKIIEIIKQNKLAERSLLTLSSDSSIRMALKEMQKKDTDFVLVHEIKDGKTSILGILSCPDIITYGYLNEIFEDDGSPVDALKNKLLTFLQTPIKEAILTDAKEMNFFSDQDSIYSLVEYFIGHDKSHFPTSPSTALVVSQDFYLNNAPLSSSLYSITSIDLLDFIMQDLAFTEKWNVTLRSHKLWDHEKRILAVEADQPILQAFKIMYNNGLQCIPVLSKTKRIIGTLSCRDIRRLAFIDFNMIEQSLPLHRCVDLETTKYAYDICLDPERTLEQAARQMINDSIESHLHHPHVWVINQHELQHQIRGCVTPTDLFKTIQKAHYFYETSPFTAEE